MDSSSHYPTLYEFLLEAELSHYFNPLKNDLKINSVAQLKYVEEEDLLHLGMSKPEQRRLKKFFHKYYPQTYLKKIKKMILSKGKDDWDHSTISVNGSSVEKQNIKVPSKHIISVDNITINKELGTGEFGIVQQGVWTNEDGERIQVAIKSLCKERMQNKNMEFLKEAAIMHTIDHEHIVRLYGVALDTNSLMLITELAPLRSLLECLKEAALRPSFGILNLCEFAQQICDGMQYLESKRLIHRDLAARNILVFSKNKVKISDFGLSRALGVGKDYYQTNFNVNLKLPVAWCAPECINYLRFTSASDVWAYGVTLWEMFSYGFQPWAALTGQQILETVDEPNFQRLEQPDCCPKEYYSLMLKCWQHDPSKRLKFCEIATLLPECKPEQVQAIQDCTDQISISKVKNDGLLHYNIGDVITVLDKRPNVWKGATNNGKTGLFNPANTVTYLGRNLPTYHPPFSRAESKSGLYTSRRRICRDMISRPQGDFKHTGHVGLDGAFFGDISFLGEKYHQLPKQVVTPYKPQDDKERSNLSLNKILSPEKSPLLSRSYSMKIFSSAGTWTIPGDLETPKNETLIDIDATKSENYYKGNDKSECSTVTLDFDPLDFGPSLMEEVFKALGENTASTNICSSKDENIAGTEAEKSSSPVAEKENETSVAFETISDNDEKNELSVSSDKYISETDTDTLVESQHSSSSDQNNCDMPEVEICSTDFKSEELTTNLSEQQQPENSRNISNDSINCTSSTSVSTVSTQDSSKKEAVQSCQDNQSHLHTTESIEIDVEINDPSPLRMLRSGMPVRPKIRGNKHSFSGSNRICSPSNSSNAHLAVNQIGKRSTLGEPPPPPSGARERQEMKDKDGLSDFTETSSCDSSKLLPSVSFNPLPLPPRDRTKPLTVLKHHQRKHPLMLPGEANSSDTANLVAQTSPDLISCSAVNSRTTNQDGAANDNGVDGFSDNSAINFSKSIYSSSSPTLTTFGYSNNKMRLKSPPPKPSRVYNSDDAVENQIQTDVENLGNVPEEETYPILSTDSTQNKISVEKVLNQRDPTLITNTNAEEVRIIQRVLKNEQVTPEECVVALNETNWDIRKAVKYLRLQCVLSSYLISAENSKQTLIRCNWDVQQAANYLLATHNVSDETTEV